MASRASSASYSARPGSLATAVAAAGPPAPASAPLAVDTYTPPTLAPPPPSNEGGTLVDEQCVLQAVAAYTQNLFINQLI